MTGVQTCALPICDDEEITEPSFGRPSAEVASISVSIILEPGVNGSGETKRTKPFGDFSDSASREKRRDDEGVLLVLFVGE